MRGKTVIRILSAGLFLYILWLSAVGLSGVRDNRDAEHKVLIIKKESTLSAVKVPFMAAGNRSDPASGKQGNQMLLLGLLMIFIAVSAGSVGFVCHLLQDS